MLLPKIAEALGITLNDLYGIADAGHERKDRDVRANDFSESTQNLIKTHLYKDLFADADNLRYNARIEHGTNGVTTIKSGCTVGTIPYISKGAAFVSDALSVISSDFDLQEGANAFNSREIASALKKLCDRDVRKVLSYLYLESFKSLPDGLERIETRGRYYNDYDIFEYEFSVEEVALSCNLSEDDAIDAIEKLIVVHIVNEADLHGKYSFIKPKGIEAVLAFQVVERLARTSFGWGCGLVFGTTPEY